ncbi:MAG: YkgJ family cysteine cluster protein [Planctomycetaceae bacterium]|jgi:Fe-S-cluster containining protein|nr:YkgJ family cysteine cluster protein [Planctomycetaceae bacterium]
MPWYDDGLQFECKQCGRCCGGAPGYVWVTGDEIKAMAEHLGFSAGLFEQSFVHTVRGRKRSLKEFPNGDCVLLDENLGCKVYENRPVQCRTWPFWEQNVRGKKAWAETAKRCPGCNQGKRYHVAEIEERINQTFEEN